MSLELRWKAIKKNHISVINFISIVYVFSVKFRTNPEKRERTRNFSQ
jgi:hypothetical protein